MESCPHRAPACCTRPGHGQATSAVQADGDHWLCILDSIKDEIFEIAHGEGHLGFHRAWHKMRGFVVHRGAKKFRTSIDQCDECREISVPNHKHYVNLSKL
ncbi:uncharacterized protein N7458_005976 [Penicillium daleae]|uniref:Uncharacterized protein n=1 Tax=Penicillium daleae TaxID=63821 RepID=A0AAD6C4M8_9EURO|nr:uncharacterized protein N7458_005976 [Penicillium daleae]KAJ5449527.1 hypothetical protein N7458_005976 [Penicillium daleae]